MINRELHCSAAVPAAVVGASRPHWGEVKCAPPNRGTFLRGSSPRPHMRRRDAVATAGKMPALHSSTRPSLCGPERLGKFIHHPVVLASADDDDFSRSPVYARSSNGHEHDGKSVASVAPLPASDFKCPVGTCGKKLLKFFRILRMAHAIAQQNHAGFQIIRLPGVKESVGGRQSEHVVWISRRGWSGMMFARAGGPGWER